MANPIRFVVKAAALHGKYLLSIDQGKIQTYLKTYDTTDALKLQNLIIDVA